MATQSIVRIRRSDSTPAPTFLAAGELAYSSNSGYLFIGMGSESGTYPAQDAVNHFIIGGKYFTDMLDHTAGTLTASSALIVDASKKINELFIDNIKIDGNTISSTDTNGNIYLAPDGTGTLDLSSKRISSLADPVSATDGANKRYVDAVASGVDPKASVRAATTANITLSGAQTIDGVSVIAGDRVLVKNQSTGSQNGIYVAAAGAWSRATDADTDAEVTAGMFTFVEEGTVAAGYGYVLTTPNPIVVGTTALTFSPFSSAGSISGTTNRITVTAGVVDISALYVGQTSLTTLGTITTGVWNGTKVAEGYGGTNQSTYTTGDTLYASASNTLSKLGIGTTGQVYQVVAGVPAWGDLDGGTF